MKWAITYTSSTEVCWVSDIDESDDALISEEVLKKDGGNILAFERRENAVNWADRDESGSYKVVPHPNDGEPTPVGGWVLRHPNYAEDSYADCYVVNITTSGVGIFVSFYDHVPPKNGHNLLTFATKEAALRIRRFSSCSNGTPNYSTPVPNPIYALESAGGWLKESAVLFALQVDGKYVHSIDWFDGKVTGIGACSLKTMEETNLMPLAVKDDIAETVISQFTHLKKVPYPVNWREQLKHVQAVEAQKQQAEKAMDEPMAQTIEETARGWAVAVAPEGHLTGWYVKPNEWSSIPYMGRGGHYDKVPHRFTKEEAKKVEARYIDFQAVPYPEDWRNYEWGKDTPAKQEEPVKEMTESEVFNEALRMAASRPPVGVTALEWQIYLANSLEGKSNRNMLTLTLVACEANLDPTIVKPYRKHIRAQEERKYSEK